MSCSSRRRWQSTIFRVKCSYTLSPELAVYVLQAAAQLAAEAAATREGQLRGALARVSEDFQVNFNFKLY